ncbi:kinase-like protein [Gymnopus androsaceus JB14]|uniref:Kinase-like protein n=1 Tax=Gymnopus androsaceus JB14 TaxID=1447944 RepID=A0A6A4GZ63_9AGAR|nr:kinase-like protein [Gymnopus androsaceus JB14]
MDLPANNFRELGITNGRRRISNNNHTASSKLQGVSTQSNGDFCPQFNDGHDEGHMLSMANPSGEPDQREPYNLTQRDFSQLGMKKTTRISLESLTQYSTPATSQISARSDPGSLSASILLKGLTMYLLSSETVADLQQAILGLAEENPNGLSQETLVEEVMEYLQAELDAIVRSEYNNRRTIFGTPGVYYKKCLRTLRQLSVSYKILPRSLVIHNINQEDRYPVVGGGFADIYHGNMGERRVCLKVLRLVIEENEGTRDKIRKEFCKEALIWRQLKHPNILPLLGVNAELFSPSFCLISPWMENKNILTYLKNNPGHNRHNVLSEVASGLYYLHSRDPPILHGDIRGANILVTDELGCCLADFGLSLIISDSRTLSNASTSGMTKGTIRWMAPELIIPSRPAPNDTSRDVYAFGCTVLEILTLQLPFHDKTTDPAVLFSLMMGDRPARPQNVWYPDAIWDLTTQCWTQEASARPNAQEIYEFFQATLTIPTTD